MTENDTSRSVRDAISQFQQRDFRILREVIPSLEKMTFLSILKQFGERKFNFLSILGKMTSEQISYIREVDENIMQVVPK